MPICGCHGILKNTLSSLIVVNPCIIAELITAKMFAIVICQALCI